MITLIKVYFSKQLLWELCNPKVQLYDAGVHGNLDVVLRDPLMFKV